MSQRDLHFWRLDGNRRVRLRRRRLTLARLIGASLLLALLGGGAALGARQLVREAVRDPDCRLREVEVVGTVQRDPELVRARVAPFLGYSLLELNLGRVRRTVEKDPWIHSATVDRIWPCRLRIHVSERRPTLIAHVGEERWLAASDGTLLERLEERSPAPGLPAVTGLPPGEESLRAAIRAAGEALAAAEREAPELAARMSSLDLSDPSRITLRLGGTDWPLWLEPRDPARNLRAYAALRPELSKDMTLAGVDLRWRGRIAVLPRALEN